MSAPDAIADGEIILRRISPGNDNIKQEGSASLRATSFAIRPHPHEKYPSWSRQSLTSPKRLLELEAVAGRDVSQWSVASASVASVRSLGLDVVSDPEEDDHGHFLIVETNRQQFTKRIWSALAKETLIVYPGSSEPR